jgi:Bardet-Biedl syndrome 9 protein
VEAEMKQIQKTIKETSSDVPSLGASNRCELTVRFQLSHVSRSVKTAEDGTDHVEQSVELSVQPCSSAVSPLRDVSVSITADPSLLITPHTINFEEIGSTPPFPTPVVISCTDAHVPMTTGTRIIATYTMENGFPQIMEEELSLPFSLFCQRSSPSKSATHKITLETNKPAVNILSLFVDMSKTDDVGEDAPTNACGFRLLPGQEVTVLASKTSERYRIQSDHLEALAVIIDELVTRLSKYFAGRDTKLHVSFSGTLPLSDYFAYIDRHFKSLSEYRHCGEVLERQAQQFRAIQKRLLMRFKDKTPTSLSHLDTLLDGTYLQLMALGEKSSSLKSEMVLAANHLSTVTALVALLINLLVKMSSEEYKLLKGVLSVEVDQAGDQGWEERTDVAVTQILKTSLAKTAKDQSTTAHSLDKVEDTQRLKRHIALLCDKILKGGKLIQKKYESAAKN